MVLGNKNINPLETKVGSNNMGELRIMFSSGVTYGTVKPFCLNVSLASTPLKVNMKSRAAAVA